MNEDSALRERFRENLKQTRLEKRKIEIDAQRLNLNEIETKISELENITEKDITGLAGRIKRRRKADETDLRRLSNGFLQCKKNIVTFANITGALNIITKMLIGVDPKLQILACECLCNMSLGDEFSCEKIALSSGSYLITYLNNPSSEICKTSLWVLGNLSASGEKSLQIIYSQKIVPKLVALIEQSSDLDFILDCIITLEAILENGKNILNLEEVQLVLQATLKHASIPQIVRLQLLYKSLMSCEFICDTNIVAPIFETTISQLITLNHNSIEETKPDTFIPIIYSIRIIGNLLASNEDSMVTLINYLSTQHINFYDQIFAKFLKFSNLPFWKEVIWFCGNFCNSKCNDVVYSNYICNDNRLKIFEVVVNLEL